MPTNNPEKKSLPRLITAVRPVREMYLEGGRREMIDSLHNGKTTHVWDNYTRPATPRIIPTAHDIDRAFEQEGMVGIIHSREQALEFAALLANFNFSIEHAYLSDLAAGLYSFLTTDRGLLDVEFLRNEHDVIRQIDLTVSRDTVWKALLGPLVDDQGRARDGAGDLAEDTKGKIRPYLNMTAGHSEPVAYASIIRPCDDGQRIQVTVRGRPVIIKRAISRRSFPAGGSGRAVPGDDDAVTISLDPTFFPVQFTGSTVKARDTYIHQIAGLTTFLGYGARNAEEVYRHLPPITAKRAPITLTMRRIIIAAQAAFEMRYLYPGIIRRTAAGRTNILLRRSAIKTLYPSAVETTKDGREKYNFKAFIDAVSMTGRAYGAAIELCGISEHLRNQNKLLIPAVTKAAEFPRDRDQIVMLKAENAANLLGEDEELATW